MTRGAGWYDPPMADDPDDPFAAEDAAYEERVRLWREEGQRKWQARKGLIRLAERPQQEAFQAFARSLPRLRDAERLFDLVEAGLGDRGVRDPWATPMERCLLVRDPQHPTWFLPQRLLYLAVDVAPNEPIQMEMEVPERIKRIVARTEAKRLKEQPEKDEEEEVQVVPLAPGGRPGRLGIYEGAANADVQFDANGAFERASLTSGDLAAFSRADSEPYTLDPQARPPQVGPVSLLLSPDLRDGGIPPEELARLVLAMRPEQADLGRVLVPVVQPGNVIGAWTRGLWNLRVAEWEGRVGDEGGWAVIDAWNGSAVATGATFDDAVEAWHREVRSVQPLPPVERPASPPPEPAPDEPAAPPKAGENVAVGMFSMKIEIHPPVLMDWPAPRPGNVPAIAVPLPPPPAVPDALATVGFTRTVRFIGEHGEVGFGFVRDEPQGFTMIGDDALGAVDVGTLESEIERVDTQVQQTWVDYFGRGDPWKTPRHPVQVSGYRVWDDLGRNREFREGGIGWQDELAPRGWGLAQRHLIMRVRYRTIGA